MRVYIDDLIIDNKYYIIEEWDYFCCKILNKNEFYGTFVSKYSLGSYSYTIFQVEKFNYLIHINSYNKFYLNILDYKLLRDITYYKKNIPNLKNLCKLLLTTNEIKYIKNNLTL